MINILFQWSGNKKIVLIIRGFQLLFEPIEMNGGIEKYESCNENFINMRCFIVSLYLLSRNHRHNVGKNIKSFWNDQTGTKSKKCECLIQESRCIQWLAFDTDRISHFGFFKQGCCDLFNELYCCRCIVW